MTATATKRTSKKTAASKPSVAAAPDPVDEAAPKPRTDLDADTALWLKAYEAAKAQIDQWEQVAQRAREHVEAALGDNEEGYVDGRLAVRWTVVQSSRVDVKKLEANHPDIVEQFRLPQITRRFTLAQ